MIIVVLVVVLVINVIVGVNMCGSDDSGGGGCVNDTFSGSDEHDTYSKYVC